VTGALSTHILFEAIIMKLSAAFLVLALLASPGVADAKGCLKGAVVGGIAGHYAGHHGVVGAIAGCAIGRHNANRRERERTQPVRG
jgi:hypothetical protein